MVANWDVVTAHQAPRACPGRVQQPDAIVLTNDARHGRLGHVQPPAANPATRHIPVVLLTAKSWTPIADRFASEVAMVSQAVRPDALPGQIASALGWAVR